MSWSLTRQLRARQQEEPGGGWSPERPAPAPRSSGLCGGQVLGARSVGWHRGLRSATASFPALAAARALGSQGSCSMPPESGRLRRKRSPENTAGSSRYGQVSREGGRSPQNLLFPPGEGHGLRRPALNSPCPRPPVLCAADESHALALSTKVRGALCLGQDTWVD